MWQVRMFKLTRPAPLSVRVRSRESWTYLYRAIKLVGWSPPGTTAYPILYRIWAFLAFAYTLGYLPIGFALSLTLDFQTFSPQIFLDVLQISVNTFGATVKSVVGLIYISNIGKLQDVLDKLDERLENDSDRQKIHKVVVLCNYVVSLYVRLYLGYTTSMFIVGMIAQQPPYLVYIPFLKWRESVSKFWIQSLLEYTSMSIAVIMDLIWDTYTIIFVFIIRGHISILRDHIADLRSDPLKTEAENYDQLVGCITAHKMILECCDLMRPSMTRTIFVQFLLIGIVLGITLLNVLYFSGIVRGIPSIFFFTAVLLETFPFCFLCDLLVDDCDNLSNALAQSNWVGAEPRYKLTVKIYMQHLQKPIIFIAGGIFLISMGNNIKVAKFAFSVMAIVQQMNLADQLT